jgi:hypothetical protein
VRQRYQFFNPSQTPHAQFLPHPDVMLSAVQLKLNDSRFVSKQELSNPLSDRSSDHHVNFLEFNCVFPAPFWHSSPPFRDGPYWVRYPECGRHAKPVFDGGGLAGLFTAFGIPVPIPSGFAIFWTILPPGTHTLTAVFTPTNPAANQPSTSPPITVTIDQPS